MRRATIMQHADGSWVIRCVDTIRETVDHKRSETLVEAEIIAERFASDRAFVRIHAPGSDHSVDLDGRRERHPALVRKVNQPS